MTVLLLEKTLPKNLVKEIITIIKMPVKFYKLHIYNKTQQELILELLLEQLLTNLIGWKIDINGNGGKRQDNLGNPGLRQIGEGENAGEGDLLI